MSTRRDKSAGAGILLVSHAGLGESLMQAATFIMGDIDRLASVSVGDVLEADKVVEALRQAMDSIDLGDGVLVLTDMFGGTPTTLSLPLMGRRKLEVITGVNLPMVIKAVQARKKPMAELAEEVKRAGQTGIVVAGEALKRKNHRK